MALPWPLLHRRKEQLPSHSRQSALTCQISLCVTGVHTCGLRTLNQNHLGNLLKMPIPPPDFLTHVVRDALEAVFSTSFRSVCCAAASGSCWVKAGEAGDQTRALGQETGIETPTPPVARCVILIKLLPLSEPQRLPKMSMKQRLPFRVGAFEPKPGEMIVTPRAGIYLLPHIRVLL